MIFIYFSCIFQPASQRIKSVVIEDSSTDRRIGRIYRFEVLLFVIIETSLVPLAAVEYRVALPVAFSERRRCRRRRRRRRGGGGGGEQREENRTERGEESNANRHMAVIHSANDARGRRDAQGRSNGGNREKKRGKR